MRAMILAAGRGKRMGALTDATPKPLLKLKGQYLIEYMLFLLKQAGIQDILINVFYLSDQMIALLGKGERYGVRITYSIEDEPLETGGGIVKALPFFQNQPFLVVSSDIITEFPLRSILHPPQALAHLIVVDNPVWHPNGDFGLEEGFISKKAKPFFTFGNIGIYHPEFFNNAPKGYFRLADLLSSAILNRQVTGQYYSGYWRNIGTPDDLVSCSV